MNQFIVHEIKPKRWVSGLKSEKKKRKNNEQNKKINQGKNKTMYKNAER